MDTLIDSLMVGFWFIALGIGVWFYLGLREPPDRPPVETETAKAFRLWNEEFSRLSRNNSTM